jgi:outer membrane protein OmpA-like peptidoglycan-associated protein
MRRFLLLAVLAGGLAAAAAGDSLEKLESELRGIVTSRRTETGIVVSVDSSLLFEGDGVIVKPAAIEKIGRVGDVLAKHGDVRVLVEDYVDDSGSIPHDEVASLNRARAVRDLLLSRGVKLHQLFVEGMGSNEPIADDSTPEGRASNRRLEIHIHVEIPRGT